MKHAVGYRLEQFPSLYQYPFNRARENKDYTLNVNSEQIPVYCHMEGTTKLDACGGGGWTLVMKINGEKVTAACKEHSILG